MASPLGFILIADLFTCLRAKTNVYKVVVYLLVTLISVYIIYLTDNQVLLKLYHNTDRIIFANTGTFIFAAVLSFIYWSREITNKRSLILNVFIVTWLFLLAAFWDSFLYNQFLCRAWLWL